MIKKNKNKKNLQEFFMGLLCISLFIGCSSVVPTSTEMIPLELEALRHHPYPLLVNVEGGGEEESFFISNPEFKKAIEQSILESKIFSSIALGKEATYQLDVFLGDMKFPMWGYELTTEMDVVWNLLRRDTGKTVWQEIVHTSFTGRSDDAISAATRARISTEGAARENIKKAVQLLSQLSL